MQQWESQIRTNLEDPVYAQLLDEAVESAPGVLAAGLVNVRYDEACMRLPDQQAPPDSDLRRLLALSGGLFPPRATRVPPDYGAAFQDLGRAEFVCLSTKREQLLANRVSDSSAMVLSVSSTFPRGRASVLLRDAVLAARRDPGSALGVFEGTRDVSTAGLLDTTAGRFTDSYVRSDASPEFAMTEATAAVLAQFFQVAHDPLPLVLRGHDGESVAIVHAQVSNESNDHTWWCVPFDPDHLVFVLSDRASVSQVLVRSLGERTTRETVRVWAAGLLDWGIDAMVEPFPKTQQEFLAIVDELHRLHENDLISRLRIGGFANHSMRDGDDVQRCQECIYYQPHRKWCDLPELPIPVEPNWWCRLWKL